MDYLRIRLLYRLVSALGAMFFWALLKVLFCAFFFLFTLAFLEKGHVWEGLASGAIVLLLLGLFTAQGIRLYRDTKSAVDQEMRERGYCVKCGYDLRVSGDRCPECGTCMRETAKRVRAFTPAEQTPVE